MKERERRNDERNEETEGGKSGGVGNYMMKCSIDHYFLP